MKLCIVGNSHAAALKSALAVEPLSGGSHVDFFVMPGGSGPYLQAERGRLFAAPGRGDKLFCTIPTATADGLDLAAFDAVLVSAVGLPSHRNGAIDHILNQLVLGSRAERGSSGCQPVSQSLMTHVMENVLQASAGFEAIRLIRSVFSGQLLVQVCPLPTRAIAAYQVANDRGSNLATQYGEGIWSFLSWYYRRQIDLIRAHAGTLSARVLPPHDSFVEAGFTPNKFKTPDPWHMNTGYGRLVLKQALAALSSSA